jgi:probable HAF family extracellular repeat protein
MTRNEVRYGRTYTGRIGAVVVAFIVATYPIPAQTLTWLGAGSYAYGVSRDGSVVAGWYRSADNRARAFRWERSVGMQDLGTLGGDTSAAYALSRDGSVLVGSSRTARGTAEAFRWTAADGVQSIGALPGDSTSVAYGVSADGAVVVGTSGGMGSERAFRWTENEGIQELSGLERRRSQARDVSADGSVPVPWDDGVLSQVNFTHAMGNFHPLTT